MAVLPNFKWPIWNSRSVNVFHLWILRNHLMSSWFMLFVKDLSWNWENGHILQSASFHMNIFLWLDSAFTFYSVFEWVMFVAICQARFWEGTLKRWSRIHVILLIDLWIHFVGMGVEFFCCAVCAHLRKIFVWRFVLFMIFYGVVVLLCFFFCGHRVRFPILVPNNLRI